MAHHIVNGMISFNAQEPWHGLGTRVSPGATPEEMLRAAKLDWNVQLRSLAVSSDIVLQNGQTSRGWNHASMKNFRAVVREDTGEVFAVPSKRYQPVQNAEIASFFRDFCDASSAELQVVGALDGGRKVWALAKVNGSHIIKASRPTSMFGGVDVDDTQLDYVMLATSHDGTLRTVAMGTSIYVVCWNTMSAALASVGRGRRLGKTDRAKAVFTLKHTSKFSDQAKAEAASIVGLVIEQAQQTAEMANLFASISLDDRGRVEFIRRLIGGESVLEQIINDQATSALDMAIEQTEAQQAAKAAKMPEETRLGKMLLDSILEGPGQHLASRKDTLWGAVNGVTYYVDHERGRTADSTLDQAWFGQGAALKADAIEVAYDMSGAKRVAA